MIISSITITESPVCFKDSKDVGVLKDSSKIALITRVGTLNKVVGRHEVLKWVRLKINACPQCVLVIFPEDKLPKEENIKQLTLLVYFRIKLQGPLLSKQS